jgi:hypothetical protein
MQAWCTTTNPRTAPRRSRPKLLPIVPLDSCLLPCTHEPKPSVQDRLLVCPNTPPPPLHQALVIARQLNKDVLLEMPPQGHEYVIGQVSLLRRAGGQELLRVQDGACGRVGARGEVGGRRKGRMAVSTEQRGGMTLLGVAGVGRRWSSVGWTARHIFVANASHLALLQQPPCQSHLCFRAWLVAIRHCTLICAQL